MALKPRISDLNEVATELQAFYEQIPNGGYVLAIEGVNLNSVDALAAKKDELLTELKASKAKAAALEQAQQDAQKKLLEEQNQFQTLYKQSEEEKAKVAAELQALRDSLTQEKRNAAALSIASKFTKDEKRQKLLVKELLQDIQDDGAGNIVFSGLLQGDEKVIETRIKTEYDFLVDGVQSTGGGAVGGKAVKQGEKYSDYTAAELSAIRRESPERYNQLLQTR